MGLSFALAVPARAAVKTQMVDPDARIFPRPPIVQQQVRFWTKVFYRYPSTTVIVHEMEEPDRIVDLIDYKMFANRDNRDEPAPRKQRQEVTAKYLARYNKALERFAKEGEAAVRHGAIEKRLHKVYARSEAALARLYAGEVKLRTQTGLADDFVRAASTAQLYLPYMEQVFRRHGVPERLTRLAFVESMFNIRARSKVGASGIWQFMPGTARSFIFVSSIVDERNNPFKATRAAAQFLAGNFRDLRAWPLAITAYNHGKVGMLRAVKQVKSNNIDDIIERYDARSFGFASRNFYAEFLAAVDVYDRLVQDGRVVPATPLPDLEALVIPHEITVAQLVKHTPLSKDVISEHNPCILDSAFESEGAKAALPAFFELHVPRDLAHATKSALDGLAKRKYARR